MSSKNNVEGKAEIRDKVLAWRRVMSMRFSGREKSHMVDILFTLALFCVFAASSLMVVMIGVNVYKKTVNSMNDNYDCRTSLIYLSEKLNQNDTSMGVHIEQLDGVDALVIDQEIEDEAYQTWIYHQDGKLKELFVSEEAEKNSESGQPIMDVATFAMEDLGGGLFRFKTVNSQGTPVEMLSEVNCAE